MPHRLSLFLIFLLLLLGPVAAHAATNPFTNPGFETGNLTGWTTNLTGGTAQVVSVWYYGINMEYAPVVGQDFLAVGGGATDVNQLVYQDFTLNAGDTLSGWAAFNGRDFFPYLDGAAVNILDSSLNVLATPWSADIGTVGDLGSSDPVAWNWMAPSAGTYRLEYASYNNLDNLAPSYGLFDAQKFSAQPTPEPGTLALLLTGLPLGLWLRRRRESGHASHTSQR